MNPDLCDICRTIPFADLPYFPIGLSLRDGLPFGTKPIIFKDTQGPHRQEPVGIPHHSSPEALAISARFCGLCGLIEPHVAQAVATLNRDSIDLIGSLHFCRCHEGTDGFLVLGRVEQKYDWAPLAAVEYCVI